MYIQQNRYDELLNMEARVNVVVEMLSRKEFLSNIDILRIIGTKNALDTADEIEKKMSNFTFREILDESDD